MTTLANTFIKLLSHTVGEAQTIYMSAQHRWQLMFELCLGHAEVKGGRSRDFPFSEQRVLNTSLANMLLKKRLKSRESAKLFGSDSVSAYHFLVVSQLLVVASNKTVGEAFYASGINRLVDLIFKDDNNAHHIIKRLLGTSSNGQDTTGKHYPQSQVDTAIIVALLAQDAVTGEQQYLDTPITRKQAIQNIQNKLSKHSQIHDLLVSSKLDLVFLKPKKVQTLIDQCSKSFLQRGASYWCSQMLSLSRDSIAQALTTPSMLLSDCDSVSIRACSPGANIGDLQQQLTHTLCEPKHLAHMNKSTIQRLFPRLLEYYQCAVNANIPTANALPSIQVSIQANVSLLDMLIERATLSDWQPYIASDEEVLALGSPTQNDTTLLQACSGVEGDFALPDATLNVPHWYAKNRGDAYGWVSTAFSLVGLNIKTLYQHNLRSILAKHTNQNLVMHNTLKQLDKASAECNKQHTNKGKLVFIKYDGDKIGKRFSSLATIERPGFSVQLETIIRDAFTTSLGKLVQQEQLSYCPVDLIYFGGDDLFFAINGCYAEAFTALFDHELAKTNANCGLALSFTFVAIVHDMNPSIDGMPTVNGAGMANEREILTLINKAMTAAKNNHLSQVAISEDKHLKPVLLKTQQLGASKGVVLSTVNTAHVQASLSPFLQRVLAFAQTAHESVEHKRKYDGSDYIVHPINVMRTLQRIQANENMLATALLHDVVEDTPISINTIANEFGQTIATMVGYMTDVSQPEDGNRKIRKEKDRQHLSLAPPDVKTVKLADLLDNAASILQFDQRFASTFFAEMQLLLEVLTEGDSRLYSQCEAILPL